MSNTALFKTNIVPFSAAWIYICNASALHKIGHKNNCPNPTRIRMSNSTIRDSHTVKDLDTDKCFESSAILEDLVRLKGRYDKDLLDMDTSVEHRTYIHLIIRLNILKEEPTH